MARLPIFAIGIYCGKLSKEGKTIRRSTLSLFVILSIAVFLIFTRRVPQPYSRCLYYPVRGLLGLSLISFMVLVMEVLSRTALRLYSALLAVLTWFGGLTLELYLLHQSWMLLLGSPCQLLTYVGGAFLLPTVSAALIWMVRRYRKKEVTV